MKLISLTKGFSTMIDDEDFDKFSSFKFHTMPHGRTFYARRSVYNSEIYAKCKKNYEKKYLLHREILKIKDPKISIDHIDGNGLNNQKSNLRICSKSQNMWNRKKNLNSSSRFKGVSQRKEKRFSGIFVASIGMGNKRWHIGHYKSEKEAALAYNVTASFAFGKFANINKVEA